MNSNGTLLSVGGLMNGSISVFSINTGGVINVLENEETISESMPISRLRCKPSGDNNVTILAATYVSGHLRYNISMSAIICKQIMHYIYFLNCIGCGIMPMDNALVQSKMKTRTQSTFLYLIIHLLMVSLFH